MVEWQQNTVDRRDWGRRSVVDPVERTGYFCSFWNRKETTERENPVFLNKVMWSDSGLDVVGHQKAHLGFCLKSQKDFLLLWSCFNKELWLITSCSSLFNTVFFSVHLFAPILITLLSFFLIIVHSVWAFNLWSLIFSSDQCLLNLSLLFEVFQFVFFFYWWFILQNGEPAVEG